MSEKEKMLAGEMYDPMDPVLVKDRHEARLLFQEINQLSDAEKPKRDSLFNSLIKAK